MDWVDLPTDYTDASWDGLRKYTQIDNDDGTVSFIDVTEYSNIENSFFGASDANQMNGAVNAIMKTINGSVPSLILTVIACLYPEYAHTTISKTLEDLTVTIDTSIYNPDDNDGLLIIADDILLDQSTYTITVEDSVVYIAFTDLEIGQTVECHIYKKPAVSATSAVLSGTLERELSGDAVIAVSDSSARNLSGSTAEIISGELTVIEEDEEN